jgi:putative flippase GtrA
MMVAAGVGSRTWLRHHPMPRYLVTGGISFLIDLGFLKLLHGILGVELILATIGAYAAAFCVNFTLSRLWTFRSTRTSGARSQAIRYTILVLCNLIATVVIVTGLVGTGLNYLVAKVISAVFLAVLNFLISRRWIFV